MYVSIVKTGASSKTGIKRKSTPEEDGTLVRNLPAAADEGQQVAKKPRLSGRSPGGGMDTPPRKKSPGTPVSKQAEQMMRVCVGVHYLGLMSCCDMQYSWVLGQGMKGLWEQERKGLWGQRGRGYGSR